MALINQNVTINVRLVTMDTEIFEKMDSAQLKSYLQFLFWHYRVVDAFWFIYTEERFGLEVAEEINEKGLG